MTSAMQQSGPSRLYSEEQAAAQVKIAGFEYAVLPLGCCWIAVKELKLKDNNSDTKLFTICPYYDNLI